MKLSLTPSRVRTSPASQLEANSLVASKLLTLPCECREKYFFRHYCIYFVVISSEKKSCSGQKGLACQGSTWTGSRCRSLLVASKAKTQRWKKGTWADKGRGFDVQRNEAFRTPHKVPTVIWPWLYLSVSVEGLCPGNVSERRLELSECISLENNFGDRSLSVVPALEQTLAMCFYLPHQPSRRGGGVAWIPTGPRGPLDNTIFFENLIIWFNVTFLFIFLAQIIIVFFIWILGEITGLWRNLAKKKIPRWLQTRLIKQPLVL